MSPAPQALPSIDLQTPYLSANENVNGMVWRWYARSDRYTEHSSDAFDRFFNLWISLTIVVTHVRLAAGPRDRSVRQGVELGDESDRHRLVWLFRSCASTVVAELQRDNLRPYVQQLAARRGADRDERVADVGLDGPVSRTQLDQFSKYYSGSGGTPAMEARECASVLAELLNWVRNNLFHGLKDESDDTDVELVQLCNPIVAALIPALFHRPRRIRPRKKRLTRADSDMSNDIVSANRAAPRSRGT